MDSVELEHASIRRTGNSSSGLGPWAKLHRFLGQRLHRQRLFDRLVLCHHPALGHELDERIG